VRAQRRGSRVDRRGISHDRRVRVRMHHLRVVVPGPAYSPAWRSGGLSRDDGVRRLLWRNAILRRTLMSESAEPRNRWMNGRGLWYLTKYRATRPSRRPIRMRRQRPRCALRGPRGRILLSIGAAWTNGQRGITHNVCVFTSSEGEASRPCSGFQMPSFLRSGCLN